MPPLRVTLRSVLFACLVPAALTAQTGDTISTVRLPVTDSALRIPVDHASELITWAPGGGLDETGAPAWRGLSVLEEAAWTIDGMRWASGLRTMGMGGLGPRLVRLEPGLNTLSDASLSPSAIGPLTFALTTRSAGDHWATHGSAETAAPFRPEGGTGDSRLEVAAGGPVWGGFRLQVGGTLGARQAASGGVGYAKAPYYLATSIDTTMEYADPSSDTIQVPIQRYSPVTRVPYTPRGTADWTARLDGKVGAGAVWAHWVGMRAAEGLFTDHDAFNPAQTIGLDQGAYDVAAGVDAPFAGRRLSVAVALQRERSEQGPLTYDSQLDSRRPGLGLMLGGLDLRWDMHNFPIDDQLVTDYRENIVGSRQSPYDLLNTDQYRLQDEFRNSPYGTYGWSEGGGPVGRLRFYDDQRFVASAGIAQDRIGGGSTTLGVEYIRHDARMYTFELTSQANSNIWIEHPEEIAATLGWRYQGAGWSLDAGVRVDRFTSGGRRPYVRVSDPAEPDYGKYVWFPRGASGAAVSDSDVHWVADQAHLAAAPHARFALGIAPGWDAHLHFQRSATVPDFSDLYDGINTDIAITNTRSAWGIDVGHEITDHMEAGVRQHHGPLHTEATYFEDHFKKAIATTFHGFYDPVKKQVNDILYHPLVVGPTIKGVALSATTDVTAQLAVTGAVTHLSTDDVTYFYGVFTEESPIRHNTLALTARLTGPTQGIAQGLGALVTFRLMSGLAQAVDTIDDPLSKAIPVRSHGVPAWKSLDLRLVRQAAIAGHHATAYIDARNLLNTANLRRAFPLGDPRGSPTTQALAWRADSASWATEADRNGLYGGAGTIDLTFGGAGRGGCGSWQASSGEVNPPDCAYLIAAEQRYGNGDGLYTVSEQRTASTSYYLTQFGPGAFNGPPRAVRVGIEFAF